MLKKYFMLTLIVLVASSIIIGAEQRGGRTAGGVSTAPQAASGRAVYKANCAICHQQDRQGAGDVFFSSRRRHTRFDCDWSSDVCSSDLPRQKLASERRRVRCFGSVIRSVGASGESFRFWLAAVELADDIGADAPERLLVDRKSVV